MSTVRTSVIINDQLSAMNLLDQINAWNNRYLDLKILELKHRYCTRELKCIYETVYENDSLYIGITVFDKNTELFLGTLKPIEEKIVCANYVLAVAAQKKLKTIQRRLVKELMKRVGADNVTVKNSLTRM